ncbi:glycosyltransferase family 2 protein [Aureimonas populi]|uniref:Glycosyltransferase family 2 protein n=1 Tax=Aureimonas populi TaxID=1701758 RepID=A0ABW5CJW2_9HYPH|nr:glycosyltransferase [Aureimonas populi]
MSASPSVIADTPREIDVIILSWNRADDTIETIRSALRQTGVAPRIWVVDQGSEPEQIGRIEAFAAGHANVTIQRLTYNSGVPGGRNIASFLGAAEIIVAIDNDAEFADETCLARTAERFADEPGLGVLGFRIVNHHTGALDRTSWNYPYDPDIFAERPFPATRFVGAGHAIRRAAFEAVGGYDDSLHFMEEEKDLAYRILDRGYLIAYEPAIVISHKISAEARVHWSSGRMFYMCRNVLYLDYKFNKPIRSKIRLSRIFLTKAAGQGLLASGLRGLVAGHWKGLRLLARGRRAEHLLSQKTLDYIWEHESRHYRAQPAQTSQVERVTPIAPAFARSRAALTSSAMEESHER